MGSEAACLVARLARIVSGAPPRALERTSSGGSGPARGSWIAHSAPEHPGHPPLRVLERDPGGGGKRGHPGADGGAALVPGRRDAGSSLEQRVQAALLPGDPALARRQQAALESELVDALGAG